MTDETGIYIRAEIDGKWQSVDIADAPLPDLDRWLASLDRDALVRLVGMLLEAIRENRP